MLGPDAFDPEALRVADADVSEASRRPPKRPPRHRRGEKFIKGPIPWDWVRLPPSKLRMREAQTPGNLWAANRKVRIASFGPGQRGHQGDKIAKLPIHAVIKGS